MSLDIIFHVNHFQSVRNFSVFFQDARPRSILSTSTPVKKAEDTRAQTPPLHTTSLHPMPVQVRQEVVISADSTPHHSTPSHRSVYLCVFTLHLHVIRVVMCSFLVLCHAQLLPTSSSLVSSTSKTPRAIPYLM